MGDFVYMVDILYIYVYMMYLDYYKELLVEQLSLKFDGSKNFSDDQKREAKSVLMNYIRSGYQYYSDNFGKLMINRYDFILKDIRDHWRETIYRFDYVGKGGRESSELRYPDTDVEGLKNWRRNVRKYRDIKDVIEGIPENPNSAYRGMSFEELVDAKRKGYFQSSGIMNIGDSQVIIEVPKSILQNASTVKSSKTNKPVGSENEYVTDKRIEFSDVLNLWLLVPERSGHGTIEVIYDKHNKKYSEGSRYSAGVDYKLMHKKGMI